VTAYEVDRRSLGGSLRNAISDISDLLDISTALKSTMRELKNEPKDRQLRVAAFWRDMNRCIEPMLAALKPNAYMIWTVGNRRVAGHLIPMDKILLELLIGEKVEFVGRVQRTIPSKRMAVKNNISATMSSETVLIMRKNYV
jgi:hypothetical protein